MKRGVFGFRECNVLCTVMFLFPAEELVNEAVYSPPGIGLGRVIRDSRRYVYT